VGAGPKAARLQQWVVEWERFCLWVVTEYSYTYSDGEDGDADIVDTPAIPSTKT
jgi:adenosine deaminase CECR1